MYCHFQVADSTIMLLRMFIAAGIPVSDDNSQVQVETPLAKELYYGQEKKSGNDRKSRKEKKSRKERLEKTRKAEGTGRDSRGRRSYYYV